jgi:hypothetical protein
VIFGAGAGEIMIFGAIESFGAGAGACAGEIMIFGAIENVGAGAGAGACTGETSIFGAIATGAGAGAVATARARESVSFGAADVFTMAGFSASDTRCGAGAGASRGWMIGAGDILLKIICK